MAGQRWRAGRISLAGLAMIGPALGGCISDPLAFEVDVIDVLPAGG